MPDLIPPSRELAQVIWTRRQVELGFSREVLAERLGWTRNGDSPEASESTARSGFSPRTIVRLEKGERGVRSERELGLICSALHLDREAFMTRLALARQAAAAAPGEGANADHEVRAILSRISNDLATLTQLLTRPEASDQETTSDRP